MLSHVVFANRCALPGNVGVKMKGQPSMIFIPTGAEVHDISGDVEFFTYALHQYQLQKPMTATDGSVVVLTEQDNVLNVRIASAGVETESHMTATGTPLVGASPQPVTAPRGLPDGHLEVEELTVRYMSRLSVIANNKFGHSGNRMFFSATPGASDDKFDQMVAAMSGASSDPSTEVKNGVPPATSRVKMIPGFTVDDEPNQLARLDRAMAIIALYQNVWSISMRTKRGHPDAYKISIPQEASQLNADLADAAANCLTGPLSGYFTATQTQQQSLGKEMMSTEIHLEFINKLFGDFSLPGATQKALDGILTDVVSSLSSLNIASASANADLNHYTLIPTLRQIVMVDDNGKDQVVGIQPIIRAFYLHVAENTWSLAIGKSTITKVNFNMNYADLTFTVNQETFDKFADKMDTVISSLVNKNCADFGKGLSTPVDGSTSDASPSG